MGIPDRVAEEKAKPRYVLVAEELTRRIQSGFYPVGTCLPTEQQLCQEFKVSRFTIRNAIGKLHNASLVSPEHGVGTRVDRTHMSDRYLLSLSSVSEIERFTWSTEFKVVRTVLMNASDAPIPLPDIAGQWLFIEGLRFVRSDPLPISLVQIYVSPQFNGIADRIRSGPIFALVEDVYGESVHSLRQEISAVVAPEAARELLQLEAGSPVLQIRRHYMNSANRTIQVSNNISVSERFTYSADIITR